MATIAGVRFENDAPLAVIAGPCMIEESAYETAARLKEETSRRGVPFVFKASYDKANRQSLEAERGIGIDEGLEILRKIRSELGVPVLTDIHHPEEAVLASSVVDCLQIPAFLCRQTDLVAAAARTGKAVNIKKGQFLAPDQMRSIVAKATGSGGENILVTERGATFGYHDLVFDPRSIEIMKAFAPVVFDATHAVQRPGATGAGSGGDRKFIPALARAAVAVGVAGLFLETHPDPAHAKSDRETQWPLERFGALLDDLVRIDAAAKR